MVERFRTHTRAPAFILAFISNQHFSCAKSNHSKYQSPTRPNAQQLDHRFELLPMIRMIEIFAKEIILLN